MMRFTSGYSSKRQAAANPANPGQPEWNRNQQYDQQYQQQGNMQQQQYAAQQQQQQMWQAQQQQQQQQLLMNNQQQQGSGYNQYSTGNSAGQSGQRHYAHHPNNTFVNASQNPTFNPQDQHNMVSDSSSNYSSQASGYATRTPDEESSQEGTPRVQRQSKVLGQKESLLEKHSNYAPYEMDMTLKTDPAPMCNPKSKKMALGSITFTSEQVREFGIYVKDNSFYLRCEKCDPIFNDRLNWHVEQVNGLRLPKGVSAPHDYWPRGALHNYAVNPNPHLQRDMDRVYRQWHDARCGMRELYDRVAALLRR